MTSLTDREREIARLVGQGMTNQQVALRLGLSPHTVSFHLRNVFRKFSISTRVKLSSIMAQAERAGTGDGRTD
ncbi:helix-turn-helix domain-containing protein [Streptomyces eurythermus]